MARAQKRNALHTQKFFFRKDVFPLGGPSRPESRCSSCSSSGASSPLSSPVDGTPRKERMLRNCWPDVPRPQNGTRAKPVEEEYEEMSLQDIMFGRVSPRPTCGCGLLIANISRRCAVRRIPRALRARVCIPRNPGHRGRRAREAGALPRLDQAADRRCVLTAHLVLNAALTHPSQGHSRPQRLGSENLSAHTLTTNSTR